MKISFIASILVVLISPMAMGQYRPYHEEDLEQYKRNKFKRFEVMTVNYYQGTGYYQPQKIQGLQVISINRTDGIFDDVYFIDKNGNSQYHTVRPTAPINLHPNHPHRYDSSKPNGEGYESIGQVVIGGVGALISGLVKN